MEASRSQPLIRFHEVSKGFGDRAIIESLNWSLLPNDSAVILGPSGSGKSVFLSILLRFQSPDSGQVIFSPELEADLFRHVAVIAQEDALLDERSVDANLAVALSEDLSLLKGPFSAQIEEAISSVLASVGLDRNAVGKQLPADLSGGMRRRLALARALIRKPRILIADEPTTGLDPATSKVIYDLMAELIRQREISSIIISHDPECARRLGHPIYYFTPRSGQLARYNGVVSELDSSVLGRWIDSVKGDGTGVSPNTESSSKSSGLRMGQKTWSAIDSLGAGVLFTRHAFRIPKLRLLRQEFYTWGLQSLPLVSLIFVLLGLVLLIQTESAVGEIGFSNRVPELLGLALTRLAPVMTGFLIAGRCGSAVAAQVGSRQLYGQNKALRTLQIEPDQKLFPAIFWSWIAAAPMMALVGMVSGWAAAWGVLAFQSASADITPEFFRSALINSLDITDVLWALLKAIIMGGGSAIIAWRVASTPKRSAVDVSEAITRVLVLSFVWTAVVDAIVSLTVAR